MSCTADDSVGTSPSADADAGVLKSWALKSTRRNDVPAENSSAIRFSNDSDPLPTVDNFLDGAVAELKTSHLVPWIRFRNRGDLPIVHSQLQSLDF